MGFMRGVAAVGSVISATGPLSPGNHFIQVQYKVDEPNASFWMLRRTLSVEGFPAQGITTTP